MIFWLAKSSLVLIKTVEPVENGFIEASNLNLLEHFVLLFADF